MSYLVLARKYRPQKFDELIGQEHIVKILTEAIHTKRVGSAYLFSGPRGVGKTSCARIFAKSLNCKDGPTLEPCGNCPACREITLSTSFDVIEIDGASNRGIDEIRTLRENVKFAPSYGRYKIYIVDEVHMLTTEAFNALLKTLEEPPEHVKFIFATTSSNKVPVTILSRCQKFDFRRISAEVIIKNLSSIAAKEKLKIDEDALFAIAKAASGSMRDALSILDQLGALSQKGIKLSDVTSMLGMVETELLFNLADSLAKKDCTSALKVFDQIINEGKDVKQLCRDLIEHFRHLMIIKIGGKSLGSLVDYPIATKETLLVQAEKFSLFQIIDAIEMFVESQETARVMDSLRIPLEVAFARLTYQNEPVVSSKSQPFTKTQSPTNKLESQSSLPQRPSPFNVLSNQKGLVDFSIGESAISNKKEDLSLGVQEREAVKPLELTIENIKKFWDATTHAVSRVKMSVGTYLQEGSPYELKANQLTIAFPKGSEFCKESLGVKENLQLLEKIFSEKFETNLTIELKIIADHKPQESEPFVKTAIEAFHGKIVSKWHSG